MKYGLDSVVATPPFSLVISWLLFLGCAVLGRTILGIKTIRISFSGIGSLKWQAPIIGIVALLLSLYPMALMGWATGSFLRIVASVLALSGAASLAIILRKISLEKYFRIFSATNASEKALLILTSLLLIGMALLASAPVTNADSLHYHVGVALDILNTGVMTSSPEWFHSRLAGNGEVLIALGLAVGAEQFGGLVQLAGILSVFGLLLGLRDPAPPEPLTRRLFVATAALSPPILVFLVGSSKPQLSQIAMTTLAFALVVSQGRGTDEKTLFLWRHAFACLLVMTAIQGKYSFILGAGIIWCLAAWSTARRKLLLRFLGLLILFATVILLPGMIWKMNVFGMSLPSAFLHPVPRHLPGYIAFESFLRSHSDSSLGFPLNLIIPAGISGITMTIGTGYLLFILFRPGKNVELWKIIGAIVVFFAVGSALGPTSSRFYLEPYFWMLLGVRMSLPSSPPKPRQTCVKSLALAQALMTLGIVWFGAATLFPGSLTESLRSFVMNRSANGYSLMKWADLILPQDAVLISTHSSIGLAPRKSVATDWMRYLNPHDREAEDYIQSIRATNPTHLLVFGQGPNIGIFAPWVEDVCAIKRNVGYHATRNPFKRGDPYHGWIFTLRNKVRSTECSTHPEASIPPIGLDGRGRVKINPLMYNPDIGRIACENRL